MHIICVVFVKIWSFWLRENKVAQSLFQETLYFCVSPTAANKTIYGATGNES